MYVQCTKCMRLSTIHMYLQQSIIFFAAGNNGGSGAQTLTTQATGKNTVAVASGESTLGGPNITYIAWYSSKGPTYDNRYDGTYCARKYILLQYIHTVMYKMYFYDNYSVHLFAK